jgi:heat shock protein HtpX
MNRFEQMFRTIVLLGALSALFLLIGYLLGGRTGVVFAFVMSLAMNIGSYWFSDKIVLSLHGAQEVSKDAAVYRIVQELAQKDGLPMPRVYLVPDVSPNAFATGRNPAHAAVCVTQGLMQILDEREVRAVLSHEMSHVKDRDILICTIAATLACAIMYLSHMVQWFGFFGGSRDEGGQRRGINPLVLLVTVILAPIASMLVQLAISRSREYLADEEGAHLSHDPLGLAQALEKISNPNLIRQFQQQSELPHMQPAFSHLYIVNHFSSDSILGLFSTHPPVEKRIEKLRHMTV